MVKQNEASKRRGGMGVVSALCMQGYIEEDYTGESESEKVLQQIIIADLVPPPLPLPPQNPNPFLLVLN